MKVNKIDFTCDCGEEFTTAEDVYMFCPKCSRQIKVRFVERKDGAVVFVNRNLLKRTWISGRPRVGKDEL